MKEDMLLEYPTKQAFHESSQRREHLTFRGNVRNGRHGWLRLTPAFSLHVVQDVLKSHAKGDFVLDPFSGTGTTPLVSASVGIPAHSVDVNPFLVWFGNIKVGQYDHTTVEALRIAARQINDTIRLRERSSEIWMPELHQIEKWWDLTVLQMLGNLFAHIRQAHQQHIAVVQDLLKIAFCRTLIETANVSFGHQSMSFKKPATSKQSSFLEDERYFDPCEIVLTRFSFIVEEMAQTLIADQPVAPAKVFLGDSRDLESALPERGYTKVITSPPYPNRMSYIRELRPYMYWLGFLTNGRQAGELDWAAIGGTWGCATSNLNSWQPDLLKTIPYPNFDRIVFNVSQENKLLGQYIHKYFQDIKTHLHSLRKVLSRRGQCYYIVGNSKFYDTLLPVEEIYKALFNDCGFKNAQVKRLRKRSSKKELFEYVVYAEVDR